MLGGVRTALLNGAGGAVAAAVATPSLLATDGMTAWYTDPRAVKTGGATFYSTVSGTTTGGNVELHRLLNGDRVTFLVAGQLEVDDHDNCSILVLSSGRLMVFYGRHGDAGGTRYRVSLGAAPNIGGFGPEKYIAPDVTKFASYSHPFLLSDGKVYLFRRHNTDSPGSQREQEMCVTTESSIIAGTESWTRTKILFRASQRPYAKYVQNGTDRIDCFTTNGHPDEVTDAGVYHMYMQLVSGVVHYYKSDGTEFIGSPPFDVATNCTAIQTPTGSNQNTSWTWEVRIGADGKPRCLSARYPTGSGSNLTNVEYWHHRWSGSAWVNTRLSQSQKTISATQASYTGGLCFDGNDTSIIYICENDAITGIAEVQKYSFNEGLATLSLTSALTTASSAHNVRPFSPVGHGTGDALLWSRLTATYTDYTHYEANSYVLGTVNDPLAVPASYETETTALLARMSVQPTTTRKVVIDRRIKRLKTAPYSGSNIWAKKALDYVFQSHDAQAARLNWKGSSGDLTVTGSPVFNVNSGYRGTTLTTDYLAGPAPNAIGAPYAQNDAHIHGIYKYGASGMGNVMRRTTSGPPVLMQNAVNGNNEVMRTNNANGYTASAPSVGNWPGLSIYTGSRASSATVSYYREGGLIGTHTDTSTALDTLALAFCYQHSGSDIIVASIGSSLTQAEVADLVFADWEYSRDSRS